MGKCPHPIGYAKKKKGSNKGVKVPVNCKKWSCSHCGKVNKKRVLDRITHGFKGERVRGMTLTERKVPDNREAQNISEHFESFRSNLAKKGFKPKFFKTVEYKQRNCEHCKNKCKFKGLKQVCEYDKTFYPHLHILINVYIPHLVIKHCWELATNHTADIVWVNATDIKKAAGYHAKYLTKSMHDEHFKKHARRYSCSMHYEIDEDGKGHRVTDFPLYAYQEEPDFGFIDGEFKKIGSYEVLVNVSTNSPFVVPKKGEWEVHFAPMWYHTAPEAIENRLSEKKNMPEKLKNLIGFMKENYPKGA